MGRKIEIFENGRYVATTERHKTCRAAAARYRALYNPAGVITANFKPETSAAGRYKANFLVMPARFEPC